MIVTHTCHEPARLDVGIMFDISLREPDACLSFQAVPYKSEDVVETPPLLLDVSEDGIILYDDGLMHQKLGELKERLRVLGSKRIRTRTGRWYWVLKPVLKPGEIIEI